MNPPPHTPTPPQRLQLIRHIACLVNVPRRGPRALGEFVAADCDCVTPGCAQTGHEWGRSDKRCNGCNDCGSGQPQQRQIVQFEVAAVLSLQPLAQGFARVEESSVKMSKTYQRGGACRRHSRHFAHACLSAATLVVAGPRPFQQLAGKVPVLLARGGGRTIVGSCRGHCGLSCGVYCGTLVA
jgi:hypothetical protein